MAHEIHTTQGFIISSESLGEADKALFLFTEHLGLIRATAQGVRKLSSKLRYALQDFSYSEVSVVMTKGGWRVVNAIPLVAPQAITSSGVKVKSLRLLKRLCGYDEPHPKIFHEFVAAFHFIDQSSPEIPNTSIEALIVLKTLYLLGYWGEIEEGETFATSPFHQDVIEKITNNKMRIIHHVNKSLRATQLL